MAMMRALGLMSGTSMDGIDLAIVETDGEAKAVRGPSLFVPYEAAFRRRLAAALETAKSIMDRRERPGDLAALESEITRRHAEAVERFLKEYGLTPNDIVIIGFHGQTVLHRPSEGLTVQLGDGFALAHQTGIRVAFDLRANDMAHGGQGAPLVPAWHAALAHAVAGQGNGWPVMFVNIGGISNVTWVPQKGDPLAFDSGPGNALIDQWVQAGAGIAYDDGGSVGSEGVVVRDVADKYLSKPFFERSGPKSLDRSDFTLADIPPMELADGARTLAHVSAAAIWRAAEHVPERPKTWVVCGGGRKNRNIMRDLEAFAMRDAAEVLLAEQVGLDGDSMEAEAWAYLAVRALKGLQLTYPGTTGCPEPLSGGVIAGRRSQT